ncbi:MAG: hypothetical protein A2776_01230 [Candidatus Levybacteria bacterium RIFCSPHIGHO2_01_FULL_40_10]|nr:MAG: hypothetical protein A2776_01230 [Candidatus Levybacteria bacterium RIFCSPHIGHO2_01_FULL_40_10]
MSTETIRRETKTTVPLTVRRERVVLYEALADELSAVGYGVRFEPLQPENDRSNLLKLSPEHKGKTGFFQITGSTYSIDVFRRCIGELERFAHRQQIPEEDENDLLKVGAYNIAQEVKRGYTPSRYSGDELAA